MRVAGYDHIYGYQARLHDYGGWKFKNPARYTTIATVGGTFLGSFIPMYAGCFLLQLAITFGHWDLYTLAWIAISSAGFVIVFALIFTALASFWLLRQVKRDRGIRGTVQLMRRDLEDRRNRPARDDKPIRLDGSKIGRS